MDIKALKKAIKVAKGAQVDHGTVIRWRSGIYTYAAVYIAQMNSWFITGQGRYYGGNVIGNTEFVDEVLAKADAIEVATEWELLS